MPASRDFQALRQKFHTWLETTFAGSGNPEVHDAWEACDFLKHNFPDEELKDLKTVFTSVQARLEKLDGGWLYHRKPQTTTFIASVEHRSSEYRGVDCEPMAVEF
jgi:hypothetical protein